MRIKKTTAHYTSEMTNNSSTPFSRYVLFLSLNLLSHFFVIRNLTTALLHQTIYDVFQLLLFGSFIADLYAQIAASCNDDPSFTWNMKKLKFIEQDRMAKYKIRRSRHEIAFLLRNYYRCHRKPNCHQATQHCFSVHYECITSFL